MRHGSSRVVFGAVVAVMALGALGLAQAAKPYGAATPQEAVAALKKANAAGDFLGALPIFSPDGLKQVASEGVTGMLMVLAFSDPDDGMPGAPTPPKAELEKKRKDYAQAVTLAKQALKPYSLDTVIGKPVLAPDTQKTIDTALASADKVVLVTSLFGALEKIGPLLGISKEPKPDPVMTLGTVTGYKITGNSATAQDGGETINFVRVDGRWYVTPPSSGSGASAAPPSAPAAQRGAAPAPAARAAAAGTQPEIVVGGVQIAKVVVSSDDFSAKPFHSDNGTQIVLWIKMPAGQGLIEIDEDTSLLQHFGDDKGTDLGGKFGSFPEEFKDGTGGIIEISSSAVPASGSTSLVAQGTVTLTAATGTRKTRVANVRLVNETKFSLGQTAMTMADVKADGEEQEFTLKLPRQVMAGIKNVAFFDARNQPVEGRRTSSGYMNDNAEMGFTVKTALKALTVEFEQWQGQKTIKVPFNVKAGLGLN